MVTFLKTHANVEFVDVETITKWKNNGLYLQHDKMYVAKKIYMYNRRKSIIIYLFMYILLVIIMIYRMSQEEKSIF
jgi:hypothetical protein